MTEGEKQRLFPSLLCRLIQFIQDSGYQISLGEMYRPPETAAIYAQQGRGRKLSLHTLKLAVDLNLFKNGTYLKDTEDWRFAGEFWESLSTTEYKCTWGGRFTDPPDGNHFSIEHNGFR